MALKYLDIKSWLVLKEMKINQNDYFFLISDALSFKMSGDMTMFLQFLQTFFFFFWFFGKMLGHKK